MSAICSYGYYPTAGNGTSALAYFPIESNNTTPPVLVNNYNPLTQAGISVVNPNGRTAAQNAELADFVAFLTGLHLAANATFADDPDAPKILLQRSVDLQRAGVLTSPLCTFATKTWSAGRLRLLAVNLFAPRELWDRVL